MTEQHMRQRVNKALRKYDPVSVENPAYPGTPDTNYIEGWIELKYKHRWPPRNGVLKIDHYTPQQRAWQLKRHLAKGRVHLLLQVGNEWLLFDIPAAVKYVGKATRAELIAVAKKVWHNGLVEKELVEELLK